MNSLAAIALVAEAKIREAQEQGQFDDLPGAGKPLFLKDDSHLPPESRMAYTILKNSGYLEDIPRSASASAEIIRELQRNAPDVAATQSKLKKLRLLFARRPPARSASIGSGQSLPSPLDGVEQVLKVEESPYFSRVLEKL